MSSFVFQHTIPALIKKIIGLGTTTFGIGPGGGREATFSGKAQYPSEPEQWSREWIFQTKFHDTISNVTYVRRQIIKELEDELNKITNNFQRQCNNYILANI